MQFFGRGEKRQNAGVVHRNILDFDARQVAIITHGHRVDVAKNIEFQQLVVHGTVIEMGGEPVRFKVVRGMLDGGEIVNGPVGGNDDDAARVLARRALDALAFRGEISNVGGVDGIDPFGAMLRLEHILEIAADIAVRGLFGDRFDRAGAEDVPLAEQDAGVVVRLLLALVLEVQVDVRNLVRRETKEGLERDVLTVLTQGRPAFRARAIRQIETGFVAFFQEIDPVLVFESEVMAMRAMVMRGQGIDLGDVGHRRGDRGTDRSTRANNVMLRLVVGHLDEFVGDEISDRVTMADDTVEFPIEAILHELDGFLNLGIVVVRIIEDAMEIAIAKVTQLLVAVGQVLIWREASGQDGGDILVDLVGHPIRVVHDELHRLFRACPFLEAIKHFASAAEMLIGILERGIVTTGGRVHRMAAPADGFRVDVDVAQDLVLGVEVMAVPRRNDSLSGDSGGFHDVAKDGNQMLFGGNAPHVDEIAVILEGLDLDVVIEAHRVHEDIAVPRQGDFHDLRVKASTADEHVLAVGLDEDARGLGDARKIGRVPLGGDLVKVLEALRVLDEDDCVVFLQVTAEGVERGFEVLEMAIELWFLGKIRFLGVRVLFPAEIFLMSFLERIEMETDIIAWVLHVPEAREIAHRGGETSEIPLVCGFPFDILDVRKLDLEGREVLMRDAGIDVVQTPHDFLPAFA